MVGFNEAILLQPHILQCQLSGALEIIGAPGMRNFSTKGVKS